MTEEGGSADRGLRGPRAEITHFESRFWSSRNPYTLRDVAFKCFWLGEKWQDLLLLLLVADACVS